MKEKRQAVYRTWTEILGACTARFNPVPLVPGRKFTPGLAVKHGT